ncbi:MAG TPA: hypothetical protein VFQ73_15170 [Flavisolibacter sp.]|nr:hypothetical protein [Flavisolibacter sp.]
MNRKGFWISLCVINLSIVAFLGFALRSKILFSMPFIDYRHLLSAHSHFAFGGWVGQSIITLLIYNLLPSEQAGKKIYQQILGTIAISSLGMAFFFPFMGYNIITIISSSLYIVAYFLFAPIFLKDLLRTQQPKTIKLLSVAAILSLLISSLGPLGLSYILFTHSGNSMLYRDSIYTFLHFQYNGFFTLSIFALLYQWLNKKGYSLKATDQKFAVLLSLSVIPALFLSLLWHNNTIFYLLGIIGCVLILASLYYFLRFSAQIQWNSFFNHSLAKNLWLLAAFSFGLKMLLNVGTIYPALGNAIYGNRPVIIGFLHLIFLGFVSFFLLSHFIESGFFTRKGKLLRMPFMVFTLGVIGNEAFLMTQGLEILFKTNSTLYSWLLWGASIVLFTGALFIAIARIKTARSLA